MSVILPSRPSKDVVARSRRRILEATTSYADFTRHYWPLENSNPTWVGPVLPVLDDPNPWACDLVGPRGFAKTSVAKLWLAKLAVFDPDVFMGWYCAGTEKLAAAAIRDIGKIITGSQKLIADVGRLNHPRHWMKTEIVVLKPGYEDRPLEQRPTCILRSISPNAKIRGSSENWGRPDVIVIDDAQRDWDSPDQADEYEDKEDGEIRFALAPNSRELALGNSLDIWSLYIAKRCSHVAYSFPDGSTYGEATPLTEDRWKHRRRFKFQAILPTRDQRISDHASLWPDRFPLEKLIEDRAITTSHIWAAEMMNDPADPRSAVFPGAILRSENSYGDAPETGDAAREEWKGCTIVGGIDPAISKKKSADYTAIATLAMDGNAFLYIVDVIWGKWSFSEQVDEIFQASALWGWHACAAEAVGYQQVLAEHLASEARRRIAAKKPADLRVIPVPAKGNNHQRIQVLEPLLREGTLKFARDHDHLRGIFASYRPNKGHDDVPVAIAYAVDLIRTQLVTAVAPVARHNKGERKPRDRQGRLERNRARRRSRTRR